jgi:hypothetical protein
MIGQGMLTADIHPWPSPPCFPEQDNGTTISAGVPTVQSAQYCDELPNGGATQGMAGGAGNATTTTPAPAGNATTDMPAGGANTTTTVTPPEGGRRKGAKKLRLRHW